MDTILKHAKIYTPDKIINDGTVRIRDGVIVQIDETSDHSSASAGDSSNEIIDVAGRHLVPGFIDIHVHGSAGYDVMKADKDEKAIDGMSLFLASKGTTAFLPTTTTSDKIVLEAVVGGINRSIAKGTAGAQAIGIHLEGPFLNPLRMGAQNPQHIRSAAIEELVRLIEVSDNRIKLVTLAPEMAGAMEAIRFLRDKDIAISAGHTDASFETICEAVDNGVTQLTHMFNAMSPLHHREPGTAGAGMMLDRLAVEVICDGHHVNRDLVAFLYRVKPRDKVVLITDAVPPCGCANGEYRFGGLPVIMDNGVVRLKEGNSLAGSTLTAEQALVNAAAYTGKPLFDLLPSLTINPAKQINVQMKKGSIEIGKDADLVILDDHYRVVTTLVNGRRVYDR